MCLVEITGLRARAPVRRLPTAFLGGVGLRASYLLVLLGAVCEAVTFWDQALQRNHTC
jgi:hypothetical protein